MRKITPFAFLFLFLHATAQVDEHFSDGDFTRNPAWTGTADRFIVNNALQLQSAAEEASRSYLFTPSEAFDQAEWQCWVSIDYPTSQYNYAAFYLASDRSDDLDACNAYYVRIGGANDAVSLFRQKGDEKEEIIPGTAKRLDGDRVEVTVRVTRNTEGWFELYSRLPDETDWVLEGSVQDRSICQSTYVGLMYANSGATGRRYRFDDVVVTGLPATDTTAPQWVSLVMAGGGTLRLTFSEPMDFAAATFEVDNGVGYPHTQTPSADGREMVLEFAYPFDEGVIYTLKTAGSCQQGVCAEAAVAASSSRATIGFFMGAVRFVLRKGRETAARAEASAANARIPKRFRTNIAKKREFPPVPALRKELRRGKGAGRGGKNSRMNEFFPPSFFILKNLAIFAPETGGIGMPARGNSGNDPPRSRR